jgi:hypothetical protein
MGAVAMPAAGASTAVRFEEQDLDILAFELWQQASCPENPVNENWLSEEASLRCRASCL